MADLSIGGIYNLLGLNARDVLRFKQQTSSVVGYPGAGVITNEQLLALPCGLLVPAALKGAVHRENAGSVQARARGIAEGADGPLTPEADEILENKGVLIVPDILTNAGGMTVSYRVGAESASLLLDRGRGQRLPARAHDARF